ncbi:MAG: hypothetical protein WCW84_05570 [Sulfurimonas sp.]|jgi:hypothetical protein
MQNENNTKSGSLIQLIRKQQLLVMSGVVAGLLIGCGGGGSTPTTTTSYTVSVVDDNIVGATLIGGGCTTSKDNGGGTYTLSGCSAQPASITAKGGFIDVNGNGTLDTSEATQDSPLIINTAQMSGTTFVASPLTTLAAGLTESEVTSLATKLGIDKTKLFGTGTETQELRRNVNAILAGASENGLNVLTFGTVLAQQIVNATGTGTTAIQQAVTKIASDPTILSQFGSVKISGFIADSRVSAVRTGADALTAMAGAKVTDDKIRVSGFVYDATISGANVSLYVGNSSSALATTTSDSLGHYTFLLDDTQVPAGKMLRFVAEKSISTSENIKLVSLISTDKLVDYAINNKASSGTNGDLIVSNVTTAKAIVAQILNPTVLTDGTLDSTMLTVESGYSDTVVKVAGAIKYVVDDAGTTGGSADTLAYAQTLVTPTGGTTGITTDHSSLVTGDVVLNGQLSTEIAVVAPTAANGIAASKAMVQELRTQALSLVDYNNSGTPGFMNTKAVAVQEATRNITGPDMGSIGYFVSAMQWADKNIVNFALNVPVPVIEATKVTSGANYGDMYGNQYTVKILGSTDFWYQPYELERLLWMNDTPHSLVVTRTEDHTYTYVFTDANSLKTYTGTFGINNLAMNMSGNLHVTTVWNYDYYSQVASAVHNTINVNVTGTVGAVSSTTGQFNYAGTVKTYAENGSLDSTFTLTNARYNQIKNGTTWIYEPLSFDGKFEMKTYTLTGKVTASTYIDIDNGYGQMIHIPKNVTFDGKASDSSDGSYISGLVNGSITNTITNINNALFDISFTGKLNVPSRPLTTVILTMKNKDANKADVTLSYTYDKTKIDITGLVSTTNTVYGTDVSYTAQFKNQAGVTIDVTSDATGKNVIGIVSKDGIKIGTIDMLSKVPRVIYYDGTFETLM